MNSYPKRNTIHQLLRLFDAMGTVTEEEADLMISSLETVVLAISEHPKKQKLIRLLGEFYQRYAELVRVSTASHKLVEAWKRHPEDVSVEQVMANLQGCRKISNELSDIARNIADESLSILSVNGR